MHPVYNVPIISQNLRKEETVVQIADALKYLSEASNDMFSRINKRIESNNEQLAALTARIQDAHAKISNLKGAKKATQVFSSSKYPAVDVHRRYNSVFCDAKGLEIKRTKIKYKDMQYQNEPLKPLEFYHVKLRATNSHEDIDGLGAIPNDVSSINDLLLYNTGKNPYKKYIISDPLQSSVNIKRDEVIETTEISAAPHSISDRTMLVRSATDSFFYAPDLGDVPSIDVPLDLPDLPGIADDLRYVDEHGQGIAPSVTTTPNIPELPPLIDISQHNKNEIPEKLVPPPPPPVEIPKVPTPIASDNEVKSPVLPSVDVKPVIEEVKPPVEKMDISISQIPTQTDNAHASLMEAIRNAGGLKKANLKTTETKKVVSGNDLMADLHAKLSLRRKGISGSKNQESSTFDPGSAMTKISAMIPPPPTKPDPNESTNTEDEDWDE